MSGNMTTINKVCNVASQIDPSELDRDEFTYIDISSIDRESKEVLEPSVISVDRAPSRARKLVSANDTLVSTVRPNLNAVAFVGDNLHGSIASTGFSVLRPNPDKIAPRFLFFLVRTSEFIDEMTSHAKGANYPAVSDRIVRSHSFRLPDLPVQHRIVAILDQADSLRRSRKEADRLQARILETVFLEAFGDFEKNPLNWDRCKLGECLDYLTSGSRGWREFYSNDGAIFIRIQNVKDGALNLNDVAYVQPPISAETERTRVNEGDILLSITADLGRTCVVPRLGADAYINQHLAILRISGLNPHFVSAFLSSPAGQRQFGLLNRSAVKAGLNFTDIRSIILPKPPRERQDYFQEIVVKFRETEAKSKQSSRNIETLFQTLLSRAFDGRLVSENATARNSQSEMNELIQEIESQSKS